MNIPSLFLFAYAYPFLALYPGAGPTGMGGAYVAIAEDAWANFYNSAGLAFQKMRRVGLEYNFIPWRGEKTHYWNLGTVLPQSKNFSFGFLGLGIIKKEIEREYYFKEHGIACGPTFSYRISKLLSIGIGIKYLYSHSFLAMGYPYIPDTFEVKKSSWAADIGFLTKKDFSWGELGFGIAVQNIGPGMKYAAEDKKDPIPLSIKLGISYTTTFLEGMRMRFAYDINKMKEKMVIRDEPWVEPDTVIYNRMPWHSFGIELFPTPIPFLAMRIGYFTDPNKKNGRSGLTAGIGICFKFLRLDISDDSAFFGEKSSPFRFSLSLNFSGAVSQKGMNE